MIGFFRLLRQSCSSLKQSLQVGIAKRQGGDIGDDRPRGGYHQYGRGHFLEIVAVVNTAFYDDDFLPG
jgi:hypothetical protein